MNPCQTRYVTMRYYADKWHTLKLNMYYVNVRDYMQTDMRIFAQVCKRRRFWTPLTDWIKRMVRSE